MSSGGAGTKPMDPNRLLAMERTEEYPKYFWYTVAGFVAVVAAFNWSSWIFQRLSSRQVRPQDTENGLRKRRNGLVRFLTALVNIFRVVAFRWTIDIGNSYSINLAELFVASAYATLTLVLMFINTTDTQGHRFSPTYYGSRAGALAAIQFPLVVALGTKNNIIGWITGLSFDQLAFVHRAVARVVLIEVLVHGGTKLKSSIGTPVVLAPWWVLGVTAASAFSLLFLVSLRPIRAKAYELFFYMHLTLALLILVAAYYHAASRRHGMYIWPSFLIWGLDRAIRFLRVLLFNHSYFGITSGSVMDATAELQSEHFVRLTVRRPNHCHWKAGQMAYLTMPGVSALPFEAHPFTIASYDSSYYNGDNQNDIDANDSAAKFWKELVFLINVREGLTKNLAKIAAKAGTVKVLLDGPYGASPECGSMDTAILVAGGSGVSFTLPVLLDIIESVRQGRSHCTKIQFIWALRQQSHIFWISDALSKALRRCPDNLSVEIKVFLTGAGKEDVEWDDTTVDSNSSQEKPSPPISIIHEPSCNVTIGRPDLSEILGQVVEEMTGKLSVFVCGSHSIAKAARSALSVPISEAPSFVKGSASVSLHVESFGYA